MLPCDVDMLRRSIAISKLPSPLHQYRSNLAHVKLPIGFDQQLRCRDIRLGPRPYEIARRSRSLENILTMVLRLAVARGKAALKLTVARVLQSTQHSSLASGNPTHSLRLKPCLPIALRKFSTIEAAQSQVSSLLFCGNVYSWLYR